MLLAWKVACLLTSFGKYRFYRFYRFYRHQYRFHETGNQYNRRLCINRKDQFVRINQWLSKIEKCIVIMNVAIRKIIELKPSPEDGTMIIINHKQSTMFPYVESFSSKLWYLLELVSSTKFSKEDCQLLHIRIIELIVKIRNQYYDLDNSKEITKKAIRHNTNILIRSRDEFKNNICSDKTYDSLITLSKEFEKEFLT